MFCYLPNQIPTPAPTPAPTSGTGTGLRWKNPIPNMFAGLVNPPVNAVEGELVTLPQLTLFKNIIVNFGIDIEVDLDTPDGPSDFYDAFVESDGSPGEENFPFVKIS